MPRRPTAVPADLRLYYIQRSPPTIPGIRNIQSYFPTLEMLFPSLSTSSSILVANPTLAAMELAVSVSGDTAIVENQVSHTQREVPIWMRPVHLLEPVDCAEGIYVLPTDGALPAPRTAWQSALRKVNDPYNEAYTDAIFACLASRLVETGRSPHWCRFYGTYNGRAASYRYNITDDMPDLEHEDWFAEGMRTGAFEVWASDPYDPSVSAKLEKPWDNAREKLVDLDGSESLSLESGSCPDLTDSDTDLTDLDTDDDFATDADADADDDSATDATDDDDTMEEVEIELDTTTPATSVRRPRVQLTAMGSSSSSSSSASSGNEVDDLDFHLSMRDFPVQMTLIERCDGTMDRLMEDEEDPDIATIDMQETKEARWTAWIFQVIAGLAVAQKEYDFVHNDLHTNNIMWCGTGETHLYYHITGAAGGDRWYRVPTYGRIMKIIDFGRATFRPPGSKHMLLPDAYAPGADAWGQYNCGPYLKRDEPKVMPNKSFDLCRLAVAILHTLWPVQPVEAPGHKLLTREPGRITYETVSPLWNLMWLWMTDKDGRSVLVSPDGSERYPHFDLYCAIARNVSNAVPAGQLTLPLFDRAFRCARKDVPADAHVWRVHVR